MFERVQRCFWCVCKRRCDGSCVFTNDCACDFDVFNPVGDLETQNHINRLSLGKRARVTFEQDAALAPVHDGIWMSVNIHHTYVMCATRVTAALDRCIVVGCCFLCNYNFVRRHKMGYTIFKGKFVQIKIIMDKKIGIGILSWNAHETLRKSLESYKQNGFLDMFDQKIIYFSDISDADRAIATEYGWDYAGGPNEGIAGGMKRLAENMNTDYVLLLQNDNPVIEDAAFARDHICQAVTLMEEGKADLARMRHRWKVGEGFADVTKYLRYYKPRNIANDFDPAEHQLSGHHFSFARRLMNRLFKRKNAKRFKGRSVFIEQNPEQLYPDYITRDGEFLIIDSAVIDFTDQCLLISKKLWLDVFVPYVEANKSSRCPNGFQAPEICINRSWWRDNHFKVLQGQGVFTHARYDGSFRPEHHTNKKTA